MFLEDRFRIDNERIGKKSVEIKEEQQIDLIAGKHRTNKNMLVVHRAVITEIPDKLNNKGRIVFKYRRYKPMEIENYEDYPYEGSVAAEEVNQS